MMNKIRDWSFPVGILVAWLTIAVGTMSNLGEMSADWSARRTAAPVRETAQPASAPRA